MIRQYSLTHLQLLNDLQKVLWGEPVVLQIQLQVAMGTTACTLDLMVL